MQMGLYTAAHKTLRGPVQAIVPHLPTKTAQFRAKRLLEAWEYGAGLDYTYQPPRDS